MPAENGSTAEEITPKDSKLIYQIEYYFGDINLARDKFLKQKTEEDDGWVALDVLLTFNRMKSLEATAEDIYSALQKSKKGLVEFNEDKTKIRRSPNKPLPEMNEEYKKTLNLRTVHLKGFPSDANFDDIFEFCSTFGKVESLELRRKIDKSFKGCVFVIYSTVEEALKVQDDDTKYKGSNALLRENKERYFERKKEFKEMLAQKKNKRKGGKNANENEDGENAGGEDGDKNDGEENAQAGHKQRGGNRQRRGHKRKGGRRNDWKPRGNQKKTKFDDSDKSEFKESGDKVSGDAPDRVEKAADTSAAAAADS